MADRSPEILLVEPDAQVLEILVASLARRLGAHVTCVADADSALDADMLHPHSLVITELALGNGQGTCLPAADELASGSDGLKLAEQLISLGGCGRSSDLGNRPVILLADELTCDQAIEAMRVGVTDLFRKPFPIELLLVSAERALIDFDLRRRRAARYRRMRDLVRRVIRERRNLNSRIELLCRDLVEAHRRLVGRVLALEAKKPP